MVLTLAPARPSALGVAVRFELAGFGKRLGSTPPWPTRRSPTRAALLAGPDRAQPCDAVPYFWSDRYDVKLQIRSMSTDYRPKARGSQPAEQLGLLRGELLVGKDAALMQSGQ